MPKLQWYNSNIRCIEIYYKADNPHGYSSYNSNIRCIEIGMVFGQIDMTNGITVTLDVLKFRCLASG